MKDVAILTKFYNNYNYGGMLQGYALYNTLLKLGYSADIISYDVNKNTNSVYPSIIAQAKQYGIGAAISKLSEKAIGKGKYFIRDILADRAEKFNEFMQEIDLSTDIYTDDTMFLLKERYKTFVSGSDQIWNPNAVRNLYLQTFNVHSNRKISYAASIGRDSFSDFEAKAIIPSIKRFGSISVREQTAKRLLEKYIDNPVTTVLDPTMLLSLDEWDKIVTPRIIKEEYLLVYFFSDSIKVRKEAEKFCKRNNLKLVMIPYAKQIYNINDGRGAGEKCDSVGPKEFLSLIKNAKFVLTDSFHGAVFSLVYRVPFAVFERNKAGHVSMNSRLYDLLNLFEENHRVINIRNIHRINDLYSIDSEKINNILVRKQKESLDFLNASLEKGFLEFENEKNSHRVNGIESVCSGCGACVSICPKRCISLEPNENGFLSATVDSNICIKCGKCKDVCPSLDNIECYVPQRVMGMYTKEAQSQSASGGIGYILARKAIELGYVVYGAAYDEKLCVRIVRIDKIENLSKIQGSKYVQADMRDVIDSVIADLELGIKVLFTGTPCEVAGVKKVAKEKKLDYNLYTTEIICHGTPSPKMFFDYKKWVEEYYKKKIVDYRFREKKHENDKDFMIHITFSDGSNHFVSGFKDPYYKLFMSSHWFRDICYECPFAKKERVADLTLGDFWNCEELPKQFGKGRRISVVLVNSKKGEALFTEIENDVYSIESSWDVAAKGNVNIYRATKKYSGYFNYSEIGKELICNEAEKGIDIKKYLFNQLPLSLRRGGKRLFKKG